MSIPFSTTLIQTKPETTKSFHDGVNKLIQDKRNPFTQKIHVLPDDLEKFLGFAVPDKDHRKPSRLLLALKESRIGAAKVEA